MRTCCRWGYFLPMFINKLIAAAPLCLAPVIPPLVWVCFIGHLPFWCHLAILLPLIWACPVVAMPPFLPCIIVSPLLSLRHTISAICHQVSVPSQRLKIFLVIAITNTSSNYYIGLWNGMVLPNLDCTHRQHWITWNCSQRNTVTSWEISAISPVHSLKRRNFNGRSMHKSGHSSVHRQGDYLKVHNWYLSNKRGLLTC